jgi:hypothetical protein
VNEVCQLGAARFRAARRSVSRGRADRTSRATNVTKDSNNVIPSPSRRWSSLFASCSSSIIAATVAGSGGLNRSSFQIKVVHDGDPCHGVIRDRECRAQCLERTTVAAVTELDAEYVERHALLRENAAIVCEAEPRFRFDNTE